MIDTLQAFKEGRTASGSPGVSSSFKQFLTSCPSFRSAFRSKTLAGKFFEAVRCGLMHDGETRHGWTVRREHRDKILSRDGDGYVLYRNNFHRALEAEFTDYCSRLEDPVDSATRANFLVRMDAICGLAPLRRPGVIYFAYGSNLDQTQLEKRLGRPTPRLPGVAELRDHRLVFNKRSSDGTAKANLVADSPSSGGVVHGCLYELSEEDFKTLHRFERGYFVREVQVLHGGAPMAARTFIAKPDKVFSGLPSSDYLDTIVRGASDAGLPPEYINLIRSAIP